MTYAGFWRRFFAYILDAIFIWLICMILIIPFWITPLCLVIAAFYHVVFETSPLRATPGKALMRMSLIKTKGSKLTIKDSIIRFVVTFISSALLCFGYLMSLFTEKRQTLHDFVADTVVVDETFGQMNFWQIFIERSKEIFSSQNSYLNKEENTHVNKTPHQSLEELYNLHQKGILSDEEYKTKKEEYLKRL